MNAIDMLKLCRAALDSQNGKERAAVAEVVDNFLREIDEASAMAIWSECTEKAIIQMSRFTAKIKLPYSMLGRLVLKLKNSTIPIFPDDNYYVGSENAPYTVFDSKEKLLDAKRIAEEYGFTIDDSFMEAGK